MKILLIVSNSVSVLIVALYLFIDNQWQNVISQAVSGTGVTYGEMYGPLSFIKAIMEYAVLIVVILNAVISVLIVKHVNKST
jgi:hypothetical protein